MAGRRTLWRRGVAQVPLKRRWRSDGVTDAMSTGSRWFQPRTDDYADAFRRSNPGSGEETTGTIFKPRFTAGSAMNDRVNDSQFIHHGNCIEQPFLAIT
ncbi:hypothetical protein WN48_04700 [Eufriesea mexicana]|nr:hypothetical protein WN48_04700 [Eufriesea mexicana]